MPSVNYRGWTPIESDPRWDQPGYYESVSARADGLARFWSQVHHEAEQREFARYAARDHDYGSYDDCAPMARDYDQGADDPEYIAELAEWEAANEAISRERIAADEAERAKMEFCESQLAELGARMMRPYEHHNEDEARIEYAERDRYGDY